ncbi:MAG: adenylate/guanylate cyclase domain-containing protein [Deltaproteobacteria bacterium]
MPRFVITDPEGQTQIFEQSEATVSIGRADTNDLVLNHPSVSRHHARISSLPGDTTLLIDLGSLNGTIVNGQVVHEHRLSNQDRITIGMYELKYETIADEGLHVEAASGGLSDVSQLISPEKLSTALKGKAEAAAPPAKKKEMEDRLKELEQENNLLKLLLGVGKTLSSVLTPEEVMRRVMELVFQMESVERGFVMLTDEKKGFLPAILLYKDERMKTDQRGVVLSKAIIERVTKERVPLLIHDAAADERFASSESLRLSGIRSAMCAPLIYKDRVFGLFYVDCLSKPWAFNKDELNVFSVIAAEAAISFDNARSHEELSQRVLERQALERFLSSSIVEKILLNPDQVHLGGENQTATILFADIRGFTRMSERMQPQEIVELLNEYFTLMTDLIFENGGTLDKYLGDGIMAVFGAPLAKPDDAARAAKTAVEMQQALARLNASWEARGRPSWRMGVGVNTGPVTAGNIGSAKRMDYTVIGDSVNLSSRLCANAAGAQILISESTFQLLDGMFPARRLDPIRVKGKESEIQVYEILWDDIPTADVTVVVAE